MALSRGLQNAVFDLVAGAAVFGLFYAGLKWVPDNHASILFLMAETIYFLAGVFRGYSDLPNPYLKVFLILVPGTSTILLLACTGYAFTAHLYVFCFLGAALLGTFSGTLLRRFFATGKTGLGSLTAVALLVVSLLAVRIAIPGMVAATLSKDADLPAPSFTFSTIDGAVVSSDQLRGRVVLLAFWATWCRAPASGSCLAFSRSTNVTGTILAWWSGLLIPASATTRLRSSVG